MPNETPNFLTCPIEPEPEVSPSVRLAKVKPPKQPRSWKRWAIFSVVFVVLLALLPAFIGGVRAGLAALSVKKAIASAEVKMRAMDVRGAQVDVDIAKNSLTDLQLALRGIGFWRDFPGFGKQIRGIEDAAGAGSGALDSASDLLEIANVIVDALRGGSEAVGSVSTGIAPTRSFSELTKQEKRDMLQTFANELPRLRLARDKMDLALEMWNRVPQDELSAPIRNALKPLAETIPLLQHSLDEAVPLIEVIVPMAGYPEPRRYLMSLQNADEIRPSGGFIGTIGTMTWDAGEMSEFAFTDVYNIDNPVSGVWKETPPEPIRTYLGLNNWFLRDANWSPDFSVSGERILDFYIREAELQLHAQLPNRPDTYVALEPGFFESLLRLTGPITADGKTFTADDFFEKIEYEVEVNWHQTGLPVEKRKEILSHIGDAMMKKIFALPASRWPEMLDLVTKALERKQIMAYSRNRDVQQLFDTRGWSARTIASEGDFLWVVDANLAALKTDGAMEKNVHYSVDMKAAGGPTATVKLQYKNTAKGFSDYRFTRYRSYTRVYVPEGSQLISSTGAMKDDLNKTGGVVIPGKVDVMKELGKTVFGAFWSVEPTKTRELSFTYRLPKHVADAIANGSYKLDWQKQPGVDDAGLTLDLSLGKNIKTAAPPEDESDWGDTRYTYDTDSLVDRSFTVTF